MAVSITALYTGILALIIAAIELIVTFHRFRYSVMVCDGDQNTLRRLAGIRGNSVENIVLCTLLMALYELDVGAKMLLQAAGIALIASRILFAVPLWLHEGPSL